MFAGRLAAVGCFQAKIVTFSRISTLEPCQSEPRGRRGSRIIASRSFRRTGARAAASRGLRAYGSGKILEELVGHFFGRAVDQPLAKLRELAADLRLDGVAQQCTTVLRQQLDGRATLGKAGDAAIALTGDGVTVRRVEIGQSYLAFELSLHWPDLGGRDRLKFGIR